MDTQDGYKATLYLAVVCCILTTVLSSFGVLQEGEDPRKITNIAWQERLIPEQYHVTREKGTERPFTGLLLSNKDPGVYTCSCCGASLFRSDTKFDSGSGWPSFYDVIKAGDKGILSNVEARVDQSVGMTRTEVLCRKCGAHLGHVFNDGPRPTGQWYCINSISLDFEPHQMSHDET